MPEKNELNIKPIITPGLADYVKEVLDHCKKVNASDNVTIKALELAKDNTVCRSDIMGL